MSHMNKLNLQLQGKGQFINQMYDYITAFVNKLRLWETQLINSNFARFPNLGLYKPPNSDKYISAIVSIKTQFESRFYDTKNQKDKFDLFAMPILVDVNTVPHEMQMEIIKLESSNMLKAKYDSVTIANFFKEYVQKSTYPHLFDNAKCLMCMFGSTYCCEQLFSKMNYTKNKLCTHLSDRHLNNVLQISSTKLPVDFNVLTITRKQHHPSH